MYSRVVVLSVAVLVLIFGLARAHAAIIPTSIYISICGDGIIQQGEACDDGAGNNTGAYASSSADRHCLPDCSGFGPYCGDGTLQERFGEECDFGSGNGSGGLCSAACVSLPAVPPGDSGSPTRGSVPSINAPQGTTPSELETKVVIHGMAFPGASVNVLLDGQQVSTVQADANANFLFTLDNASPGTATFSFSSVDKAGVQSFLSSATFDVIQGAITTVSNIFLPPTISESATQVSPGDLLTLSGQTVPGAQVVTQLSDVASTTLNAPADSTGGWALQIDTGSLSKGYHTAKSYFQLSTSSKSGFGRSVNFLIGSGTASSSGSTDLNGDSRVNLVDFSIFLTLWNSSDSRGDFNHDGKVNLADFSILLFNWTG